MSICLKRVDLKSYGPLGDKTLNFKKLNLIYGPNETGKTFLTEFLLQSVFRHPLSVKWPMRDLPGQGKVLLSGIEEQDTSFTPSSRKKLEDFWEESHSGLPTNMARLLVVKGGELELVCSNKESNHSVLMHIFSQEAFFTQILKGISKTTQSALIEDGEIIGDNRSDLSFRQELINDRRNIEKLIDDINDNYSLGPLREKQMILENLNREVEIQEKAKRYLAFQLDNQIQDLEKEKEKIPANDLEAIRDDIRDCELKFKDKRNLSNEFDNNKRVLDDYPWLNEAVQIWEAQKLDTAHKPNRVLLWLAGILSILGLIGTVTQTVLFGNVQLGAWSLLIPVISTSMLFIGLILIGLYIWRQHTWSKSIGESDEREAIKTEFKTRFNRSANSLTDLKVHLEKIREEHYHTEDLKTKLDEIDESISSLTMRIEENFYELIAEKPTRDEWYSKYESLKQHKEKINDKLGQLTREFDRLNIKEDELNSIPAEEHYDREKLEKLILEKEDIHEQLRQIEEELGILKQRACQETGDSFTEEWGTIHQNAREKLENLELRYKQTTAKIIGQIGISRVLEIIQTQEEEKVRKNLASKEVVEVLSKITGHYGPIDMDGDQLIVTGNYGDFGIEDLSTGAREQVYLTLRMGFASKLAGGKPLFMVLDDAFQHSDWARRERLFDSVFKLIDAGWQVTYLTMDDHIRDLCCELGNKRLGNEFVFEAIG